MSNIKLTFLSTGFFTQGNVADNNIHCNKMEIQEIARENSCKLLMAVVNVGEWKD